MMNENKIVKNQYTINITCHKSNGVIHYLDIYLCQVGKSFHFINLIVLIIPDKNQLLIKVL